VDKQLLLADDNLYELFYLNIHRLIEHTPLVKFKIIATCILRKHSRCKEISTIYQTADRANGFKNWSLAHPPGRTDDDDPGDVTPIALALPALDEPMVAPPEQPHRP
jgi:hypothetical protein